jgi:hypothetical protein
MAQDAFLEALAALEDTLADNQKRTTLIKKRIAQLRRLRSKGASYNCSPRAQRRSIGVERTYAGPRRARSTPRA